MNREHGPNPYPHDSLNGQLWELNRALRDLGRAIQAAMTDAANSLKRTVRRRKQHAGTRR